MEGRAEKNAFGVKTRMMARKFGWGIYAMRRITVAPAIAGILASCAATPADRTHLADDRARTGAKVVAELKGLMPSSPQNCLDSYRLRNATAEPYGDTILYRVGPNLIYRNDTSGGCVGLNRGETLIDGFYAEGTRPGQMCRGDLLHSGDVHSGMLSGSCTRGTWIAYTK